VRAAYLIGIVLYVAGLSIRDGYELLKRGGRIDPTNARVFAVVFTSMIVMWLSWFAVGMLAPAHLAISWIVRWAGLSAVLLGTVVSVAGMWQLGGVENIDHLVKTGLFSRVRHPMYVGFILWIIGWCAYASATAVLVLAPFGLVSILWWRRLEESELATRYGSEYVEYRASTWF
jgi:protein-S-isoprenylcysteine O-methyltransferase Ste14